MVGIFSTSVAGTFKINDPAALSTSVMSATISFSPSITLSAMFSSLSTMLTLYPWLNNFFRRVEVPKARSCPSAMIAIRSPKISASSIEWVVKTITLPFLKFSTKVQTCLLLTGSIPVVGSSMKMILGSPIVEIATERRRFIPPLYVPAFLCLTFQSLTEVKRCSIRGLICSGAMFFIPAKR
eukprot:Lithocolla_globosa_v1_NODE_102_length_6350_cov_93.725179.p3 type:complete len:182 gc:universal NODE_102_length_6350_cov_93.725179:6243-5698(-)